MFDRWDVLYDGLEGDRGFGPHSCYCDITRKLLPIIWYWKCYNCDRKSSYWHVLKYYKCQEQI